MELKRIFQAWNDEVNEETVNEESTADSQLKQQWSNGSRLTASTGNDESVILPPNGKSLSGSRSRNSDPKGEQMDPFSVSETYEEQESLQTGDGFVF